MSCPCDGLTDGILKGCDNNIAGIRNVWLYPLCNATITDGSPSGYKEISLVDKMYKFEFGKGTSTFTEDKTGDQTNGSEFYTQTLTIKLNRREKSKRAVLLSMAKYTELGAVVEDNNGLKWLLGEVDGLILTENKSENGTNKTDFNGYTLTLVGEEEEPAGEISAAHWAALVLAGKVNVE